MISTKIADMTLIGTVTEAGAGITGTASGEGNGGEIGAGTVTIITTDGQAC